MKGQLEVKGGASEKQYYLKSFCEKKDGNSDEYKSNQRKKVKLSYLEKAVKENQNEKEKV